MFELNPIENVFNLNLPKLLDNIPAKDFDDLAIEIAEYQELACGQSFDLDFNSLELLISVLGSHFNRFSYCRLVKAYGLNWHDCLDYYDTVECTYSGKNLKSVLVECLQFIDNYIYEVGTIEQYKSLCGYLNDVIKGWDPGTGALSSDIRAFEVVRYILGYAFILQRYDALYNDGSGKYSVDDYLIKSKCDGNFYYPPVLFETSTDAYRYLKSDFSQ